MSRPPVTPVIPHKRQVHGHTLTDNYHWLRQRGSAEVRVYLEAENRYTEACLKHTKALEEKVYREIRGRVKEDDLTVPERIGDYIYYTRMIKGRQYPLYCRKRHGRGHREEVLLDANRLARGLSHFEVGAFKVSPDGNLLAYTTDTRGNEAYSLYIKDLASGKLLPDRIDSITCSLEWADDNGTLFYTRYNTAQRPFQLYRHRLGDSSDKDTLVYQERDDAFHLSLTKTRSQAYLLLHLDSMRSSETRFLDASQPTGRFRVIAPRRKRVRYGIEHHKNRFLILTNDRAKNFKVMTTPVDRPDRRNWKTLIRHRRTVFVQRVEAFRDHLVIHERRQVFSDLAIHNLRTKRKHRVHFPHPVHSVIPVSNPDFNTSTYRFIYTSLVSPSEVVDYDMDSRKWRVKKRESVRGGYAPSRYESRLAFAHAADGTRVPISMVSKKRVGNGPRPTLLLAYGAYGICADPVFLSGRLSLLDRGFIIAIAHVRGGSEMGRGWYEDGRVLRKMNTITDFIACAEYLVDQQLTTPRQLAICSRSAGGLLLGAACNRRPNLFQAVIAQVPFVDLLNTMLEPKQALTVLEYEEWGNPGYKSHFEYMLRYAPCENAKPQKYPHMLITAGYNDPRVPYWEAARWAATLRSNNTGPNPVLLKTDLTSGHGGPSGRYARMRETAFEYAFLLDRLGADRLQRKKSRK